MGKVHKVTSEQFSPTEGAVDLKLAPTFSRRLRNTVERFGITMAAFHGFSFHGVFYHLPSASTFSTARPPTTHPPCIHHHATLVLKLVPT